MRGEQSNTRIGDAVKRAGTTQGKGQHNSTPLPPFNTAATQTEGGRQHADGRDSTTAPALHHYATHHPLCHPPFHNGPTHHRDEGGAHRGYPTTRTAQTNTHHPHTTHLARNSTRHDSSTRQHCSGTSRARATPLHWAGQQQHPTAIPHTEENGHHPLIHSHSFLFTQQMINVDQ